MGYFQRKINEEIDRRERRQKAPEIMFELVGKTNLDSDTIKEMMKGYVNSGEMAVPSMIPEGVQGPLAPTQQRETPTDSLRPPAYVFDEDTQTFNRAPEGVSDPIKQIRELGRFRYDSDRPTGNWFKDDSGQWQRWVPPAKPSTPRFGSRETDAARKERLAIEAVTSALRQKMMINPLTKMTEPILDRNDAVGVAVSAGLDITRYPEIAKLIEGYTETPAKEPEQPGLFQRWFGKDKDAEPARAAPPVAPAIEQAPTAPAQTPKQEGKEIERRTKTGKIAIFDAETKQFLRWK